MADLFGHNPTEDLFEVFWKEYPRKIAKKAARVAYNRVIHTEKDFNLCMLAIKQQTIEHEWNKPGKEKFIPYPATWLNQERFRDVISDTRPEDRVENLIKRAKSILEGRR